MKIEKNKFAPFYIKERSKMSKKSKSKRFVQQGKDYVQPANERERNVKTMDEVENNTNKGEC